MNCFIWVYTDCTAFEYCIVVLCFMLVSASFNTVNPEEVDSVDSDDMAHHKLFNLGLHCLHCS